MHIEISIPF